MQEHEQDDRDRVFLTLAEVGRMLRLDEGEVALLLETGELRGIRIGSRSEWRIERAVLEAWLDAKYEESRRAALWLGFDYGSVSDLDPAPRSRPQAEWRAEWQLPSEPQPPKDSTA